MLPAFKKNPSYFEGIEILITMFLQIKYIECKFSIIISPSFSFLNYKVRLEI